MYCVLLMHTHVLISSRTLLRSVRILPTMCWALQAIIVFVWITEELNSNWRSKNLTVMTVHSGDLKSVAIFSAVCLANSQRLYPVSSSGFFEAVLGCREATIFEVLHGRPTGRFFEPSCNGSNLCKNSIWKVKGSKIGIYYNASFLPGHSLIFSLPTL